MSSSENTSPAFVLSDMEDPHFILDKVYAYAKDTLHSIGKQLRFDVRYVYMPSLSPLFVGKHHAAGYLSLVSTMHRLVLVVRASVDSLTVLSPHQYTNFLGVKICVDEVLTSSLLSDLSAVSCTFEDMKEDVRLLLEQHIPWWRVLTEIRSFVCVVVPDDGLLFPSEDQISLEKKIDAIIQAHSDTALCVLGELQYSEGTYDTSTADHMIMTAGCIGESAQNFPDEYIYNMFVRIIHSQGAALSWLGYTNSLSSRISFDESVGYALGIAYPGTG